ncbi:putative ribonuclease H-like domain-containing protein [Tanacetum coccineum]
MEDHMVDLFPFEMVKGRIFGKAYLLKSVLLRSSKNEITFTVVDLRVLFPNKCINLLFAKATIDESNLWHRRLGHINFKNINKLVKGNLVRGLPSKIFENNHSCVACQKGKQHKASYKDGKEQTKPQEVSLKGYFNRKAVLYIPTKHNSIIYVSYTVSHLLELLLTNDDTSSLVNAAEASNAFEEHIFERFSPFKNAFTLPPVSNVTPMDDTGIFGNAYDDEDVGAEVDLKNLETTINVSPIPTTRIDKDHPKDQIIGDFNSAIQTRRMTKISNEHAMIMMYLTASTPDITFAICACARFQVTPKTSHLHAVKRIFRYLKGQPKLVLWKSTTGGCQFLDKRLISWQCKKHNIIANSTTEEEYVAAASCYGQNWITQSLKLKFELRLMRFEVKTGSCKVNTARQKISTARQKLVLLSQNETVYKEWEDRMERTATTASSLDAEQNS